MNILFLSLGKFESLDERGIYTDLLKEFTNRGNQVYCICSSEEKMKKVIKKDNSTIIKTYTGKIQKTNKIIKGINTLLIEHRYLNVIKSDYKNVKFNLVIYPTPPITFSGAVNFVKKRDGAASYLLLKDIFPQNAVDLNMLSPKSFIYKYFRNKEKNLYKVSDYIGCMSQGNKDYLLTHNSEIQAEKVEVCPNSIRPNLSDDDTTNDDILNKFNIPKDKIKFIYGGNLGEPQGIDYLKKCLSSQRNNEKVFFVIVGSGTRFADLKEFIEKEQFSNVLLLNQMPKNEYEDLNKLCDIGLIFLDSRFTIPNIPSRILSYMDKRKPVLALTDKNTDLKDIIEDGDFGWWGESNSVKNFEELIPQIMKDDLTLKGENAYQYLLKNYDTKTSYQLISDKIQSKKV